MTKRCPTHHRARLMSTRPALPLLMLLLLAVAFGAGPLAACDSGGGDGCPQPVRGWETRTLSVAQMEGILADLRKEDAVAHVAQGITCAAAPIGVDERNGLAVYLRVHCDDVCPDYADYYITYGDDLYGQACEPVGQCVLLSGAAITPLYCLPFSQGYSRCY